MVHTTLTDVREHSCQWFVPVFKKGILFFFEESGIENYCTAVFSKRSKQMKKTICAPSDALEWKTLLKNAVPLREQRLLFHKPSTPLEGRV